MYSSKESKLLPIFVSYRGDARPDSRAEPVVFAHKNRPAGQKIGRLHGRIAGAPLVPRDGRANRGRQASGVKPLGSREVAHAGKHDALAAALAESRYLDALDIKAVIGSVETPSVRSVGAPKEMSNDQRQLS